MISEQKQRATDLITSLNRKEVSLLLRIWDHGMECVNAFISSGSRGYSEALKFVDEWEAQHE